MNMNNLKVLLLLIIIEVAVESIPNFPWWSFVISIFAFGVWIGGSNFKVSTFILGFCSGFFCWTVGNLYFHFVYNGTFFQSDRHFPVFLLLLGSGLLGGVLSGLAFYTGSLFFKKVESA